MKDSTFEISAEVDDREFGAVITTPVKEISVDMARRIVETLRPNHHRIENVEVKKVDYS